MTPKITRRVIPQENVQLPTPQASNASRDMEGREETASEGDLGSNCGRHDQKLGENRADLLTAGAENGERC